MAQRMLEGFALYTEPMQRKPGDHNTIAVPLGTRLYRIIRMENAWRLWTATADFRYGTYLMLHDDGMVRRVVVREGEGDEEFVVRPSDEEINT